MVMDVRCEMIRESIDNKEAKSGSHYCDCDCDCDCDIVTL